MNFDGLVKNQEMSFFVIPAKAGIQSRNSGIQSVTKPLDPVPPFGGIQRGDDFLRMHQVSGAAFHSCVWIHLGHKPQNPGVGGEESSRSPGSRPSVSSYPRPNPLLYGTAVAWLFS